MCIGHYLSRLFCLPLIGTGRTLCKLPLKIVEIVKEIETPFRRSLCPDYLKAACDCVSSLACPKCVVPSKTLRLQSCYFGLCAYMVGTCRTVGFTKCVTSGNKCYCFIVVHRHSGKCIANILSCSKRIGNAVRPFGINVNQAHLNSCQRVCDLLLVKLPLIICQPLCLRAPVNILVSLPNILTPSCESECLETH